MHNIFLSHTAADKPFARSLAESLKNIGITVWIDEAEIKVGDSLIEKIRDGIDKVEYVGVILSPAAVKSNWVKKELDVAMNQEMENEEIKVIPILHKKCDLPGFLKGKRYADFTKSFIDGFTDLAERLDPFNELSLRSKMGYPEQRFIFVKEDAGERVTGMSRTTSIDGSYQINGTNPNGKSYHGIAEIVIFGNQVTITSVIGKNTFVCRGVVTIDKINVTGDFEVNYTILASGQITGIWNDGGTETLIPHHLLGNIPIRK